MNTQNPRIRLLYSDVTPQAYLFGLWLNSRSAGLVEDEAGRIFSSRLVDDLGLLNKLWDGRDVTVDRRTGSFKLRAPRTTINWMVQPEVFRQFMERKGENARGVGFLARCLVCYPQTTQGTRLLRQHINAGDKIAQFRLRILELLNDQVDLLTPEVRNVEQQN
jgi:hypothetical protein